MPEHSGWGVCVERGLNKEDDFQKINQETVIHVKNKQNFIFCSSLAFLNVTNREGLTHSFLKDQ